MAASYGGVEIFGRSVKIAHYKNPSEQQINEFFGISGQQTIWGGFRGRVFMVEGVLVGANQSLLNAAVTVFTGPTGVVGDGRARTLIDTRGQTWLYVLAESFTEGRQYTDAYYGKVMPYKAVFRGLI